MPRTREPLLWELADGDEPSTPIIPEAILDEIELRESQREEVTIADDISEVATNERATDDLWLGGDRSPDKIDQPTLFENEPSWIEHWKGMPEFAQRDLSPYRSIAVHFKSIKDRREFAALIGQTLTDRTRSIWYPRAEIRSMVNKRFKSSANVEPRYPIYVISKGRWESRLTMKSFDAMCVPYKVVIEPQEYDRYAAVIAPEKILVLPFSNLGQGSIPARNWVWEHAIAAGASRHWIVDDNIDGFIGCIKI